LRGGSRYRTKIAGWGVSSLLRRGAALPEMATAVLIMDEDRRVEFVNASGEMLFTPIDPIGCTLPALFASCGATGGDDVFARSDSGVDARGDPTPIRLRLGDDRLLDLTLRPLSSGGFVLSMDDVTELVRIAELARHDALTGLANRGSLRDQLAVRLAAAARSRQSVAVLYIDLDRFKAVNDTFGHATGDALLKAVAERLHQVVRAGDALARLGGDEFAILHYPGATEATTQALAARITESIARPYTIGDDTMSVGVSVGICLQDGTDFDTESAMKLADKALYAVKQAGGGTFTTAF
jgi:diguanylate cyclase (GGDEF)-like protein